MSQALTAGKILRCNAYCQQSDQTAILTWHYRVFGVGSPAASDEDVANALDGQVGPGLASMMAPTAAYRGVTVQIIWPLPIYERQFNNASAANGTSGTTGLPRQVCGITEWKTPMAGRFSRGRTYWPFPSANALTAVSGEPNPTYKGVAETLATNLDTVMQTISIGGRTAALFLCLYNRTTHDTIDVTDSLFHEKWATQRRRGDYGKENTSPI